MGIYFPSGCIAFDKAPTRRRNLKRKDVKYWTVYGVDGHKLKLKGLGYCRTFSLPEGWQGKWDWIGSEIELDGREIIGLKREISPSNESF